MRIIFPVLVTVVLGSASAFAQSAPPTADFVRKAEIGGQLEVQAGHIAAEKGTSPAVKHFGERMVRDHTRLNEKLRAALAKDKDKSLPKETALDAEAQAALEKLKATPQADFDRVYIDSMVEDHQKDAAAFKSYAQSGSDKIVRQAAKKALPVIERHLSMAEKIQKRESQSSAPK